MAGPGGQFDIAEARRLYESGLSVVEVSDQLGVSFSRVARHLRAAGVAMRPTGPTNRGVDSARVVELRDSGLSWTGVAAAVGMSEAGVRQRYLAATGQPRRGSRPAHERPVPAPPTRKVRPKVTDEQLLELKSWGATHREVAVMVGMTHAAVQRLHRARRRSAG